MCETMILCLVLNKKMYLCKIRNESSYTMELNTLIAECTAYDFKVMLEEKKPKSWLKSVSAFANGLGGSLFFGVDNDGIIFASTDTPNVGDYDGDVSETKLTERQQKILNLIKESPTVTGKRFPIRVSKMRRNTAMET